jgi:hypothetical protein
MEDVCGSCSNDWKNGMKYHFDFWLNSDASSNAQSVLQCEDNWTKDMTTVEIDPPPGRRVDPMPLYNTQTNMCSTTP